MINWYTRFLCHHPYVVLSTVIIVVATCLGLSLFARPLPNFNDPALGFESRGTVISDRTTAWENLMESTETRGPLMVNPLQNPYFHRKPPPPTSDKPAKHKHKVCVEMTPQGTVEVSNNCTEIDNRTRDQDASYSFVNFEEIRKIAADPRGRTDRREPQEFSPDYQWPDFADVDDHFNHAHHHVGPDGFFCGELLPGYGHVVVESSIFGDNLFTLRNLLSICQLDQILRSPTELQSVCENTSPSNCCPSWSLPNYVAVLSNRTSCLQITEGDVMRVRRLLRRCAKFLDLELEGGCDLTGCHNIPQNCLDNKAVYTILHFLTDAAFLQPQVSARDKRPHPPVTVGGGLKSPHSPKKFGVDSAARPKTVVGGPSLLTEKAISSGQQMGAAHVSIMAPGTKKQRHHLQHLGQRQQENRLSLTAIFLPVPRSPPTLPYFEVLQKQDLTVNNLSVVAMDLGLKNDVFNKLLLADAYLLCVGGGVVVLLIWLYTGSLFITVITLTSVACSLLIAYFLYVFVYDITFFPYMNVLTAVIAIGLGADDTFIYCRVWRLTKQDNNCATMIKLVTDSIHHAAASICVTSFTTAAAFLASFTSHITAVKCFSIFAGTVVIANLVLMVTWVPACVVIAERWGASSCCLCVPPAPVYASTMNPKCSAGCARPLKFCYSVVDTSRVFFERILPCVVIKPRYFWIFILGALAAASAVVVFYRPGLRLPDTQEFQLFDRRHPFEKYDLLYRYEFWFERNLRRDIVNRLPIRVVWGVLPVDNGDYLNPAAKGDLEFDPTFDVSAPQSQLWLLQFCRSLRNQTFYMSTLGPLLPNCFIETFKVSMERRCIDPQNGFDRSPCCEASTFPYQRHVFDQCIHQGIADLYETPREFFIPGVAGPKFMKKTGKIQAVVVEYDSTYIWSLSYEDMNAFFLKVNTWVSNQMANAPRGMKNGWFISYLSFYDVQKSLSIGTGIAVGVAIVVCLAVLLLTTLNVIVSLLAIVSVAAVMVVTLAALVLMGWRLNVLESVTVSVAIGLAVDLTLHYGVAYRLSPEPKRDAAVTWATGRLGAPVFMAALTSICAGASMIPARVLAYVHVGTFLTILTATSYVYATFFYLPLLRVFGPETGCGQLSYRTLRCKCVAARRAAKGDRSGDKAVYQQAFMSESTLSTSSNCCPNPSAVTNISDNHELEPLTNRGSVRSSKKRHSSVSRMSSGGFSGADDVMLSQSSLHRHQYAPHAGHSQHNGGTPTAIHASAAAMVFAEDVMARRNVRSGSLSSSLSLKERRERALRKISLPADGGGDGSESCEMAEPSPKQLMAAAAAAITTKSATTALYGDPIAEAAAMAAHAPVQRHSSHPSAPHSPFVTPQSPFALPPIKAPQSPSYMQQYHHQAKLAASPKRKGSCASPLAIGSADSPFTT